MHAYQHQIEEDCSTQKLNSRAKKCHSNLLFVTIIFEATLSVTMTDYSKLKVPELKEELKARGIPLTGLKLKQNFIDKLIESDASGQTHTEEVADARPGAAHNIEPNELAPHRSQQGDTKSGEKPAQGQNDASLAEPDTHTTISKDENDPKLSEPAAATISDAEADETPTLFEPRSDTATDETSTGPTTIEDTTSAVTNRESSSTLPDSVLSTLSSSLAKSSETHQTAATTEPRQTPQPASVRHASTGTSTPLSSIQVPASELLEDSRKRKRRSVSPPPSAAEVSRKRARAVDGSPRTTQSEDFAVTEEQKVSKASEPNDEGIDSVTGTGAAALMEIQKATDNAETIREGDGLPEGQQTEIEGLSSTVPLKQEKTEEPPLSESSPLKKDTHDVKEEDRSQDVDSTPRLSKSIMMKMKARSPSPQPPRELEERNISPALHQATSSLYIRNFKRPLHIPTLKAHISALATSPSSLDPPKDPIATFYLDSIRTHAFISFTSISAASRVRSTLHESRFPEEKTRDPLWVDFMPDDKVQPWIDVENDAAAGRGMGTRWEVVYEDGPDGVKAVLQEAVSGGAVRKQSVAYQRQPSMAEASRVPPPVGVHPDRAVLVPRDEKESPRSSRRDSHRIERSETSGTGFRALDELFSFTAAKPKLYYKPVPPQVAERRTDAIKDLRVGHAGMGRSGDEDMKRYTFEAYRGEEEWVDKGPEFGFGRRGADMMRRGGGGGGMRGGYGRGGYRDEAWRGRR